MRRHARDGFVRGSTRRSGIALRFRGTHAWACWDPQIYAIDVVLDLGGSGARSARAVGKCIEPNTGRIGLPRTAQLRLCEHGPPPEHLVFRQEIRRINDTHRKMSLNVPNGAPNVRRTRMMQATWTITVAEDKRGLNRFNAQVAGSAANARK